jgi:hypothetical protein
MLKLELTDGEQTIEGMEYQPMTKLSTDLIPGTKVGSFFKFNSQILINSSNSFLNILMHIKLQIISLQFICFRS